MNRERGVTIPIVALSITMLFAFAALAIDIGVAYSQRTQLQAAADASALAGAASFIFDAPSNQPAAATNTAQALLNVQHILGPKPTATYTVDTVNQRVHVELKDNAPAFFARVFGWQSLPVKVHATAEAYPYAGATWRSVPMFVDSTDLARQMTGESAATACSSNQTIIDANGDGNLTGFFTANGYGHTLNIPWGYQQCCASTLIFNSQMLVLPQAVPTASQTLCAVSNVLSVCSLPRQQCGDWVDKGGSYQTVLPADMQNAFNNLIGTPAQDTWNSLGNYTTASGASDMSKSLVAIPVTLNSCLLLSHPCPACIRIDGWLFAFITGTTPSSNGVTGYLQTRIVGAAGCKSTTGTYSSGIGPAESLRLIQP